MLAQPHPEALKPRVLSPTDYETRLRPPEHGTWPYTLVSGERG